MKLINHYNVVKRDDKLFISVIGIDLIAIVIMQIKITRKKNPLN